MSSKATTRPMRINYGDAIRLALGSHDAKMRALVLAYFHEDEHGNAGRALDELVLAGEVEFDGTFYRRRVKRAPRGNK